MITFNEIPGEEISIFLLLFIGFTVGVVGGFIGVGGGFLVTPALVVLGFPSNYAVGTDTTHIAGKSIIATIRHSALGNVAPARFAARCAPSASAPLQPTEHSAAG